MNVMNGETKLLVADDDPTVLETILDFIKEHPAEVIYAPDGERAIHLARTENPDLIIMDWEMPKLTGIQALRVLMTDPATCEIPVIIATGTMVDSADLETALESGAVDFLRKPLEKREFCARARSSLRIRQQQEDIKNLLNKEKELIQQTLEQKERELSSMTMFDFQKNQLLNKLLDQVSRLNRITNYVYATDIKAIERELKSQLNLEKSWFNFKRHFDDVHPGFFDYLTSEFKGLSQNDHKLCAYIRIGLGNKEIASFTNVARTSVDRAMNRLKKKLGLSEKDNLRGFVTRLKA
ncbi:MAG: response regulator [Cyclobacteriaceae bacterium]|nr:response regulator [Cyclobacteriaceae bacterium HetDA_MAG_MS6]